MVVRGLDLQALSGQAPDFHSMTVDNRISYDIDNILIDYKRALDWLPTDVHDVIRGLLLCNPEMRMTLEDAISRLSRAGIVRQACF